MRLLLDTNVLLWAALAPDRLSSPAREAVVDVANERRLSAASCWELAIKAAAGKLDEVEDLGAFIARESRDLLLDSLAVTALHALQTRGLPLHHRDPFDRLLVAQAQVEGLAIVTNDPLIARYGVETIW